MKRKSIIITAFVNLFCFSILTAQFDLNNLQQLGISSEQDLKDLDLKDLDLTDSEVSQLKEQYESNNVSQSRESDKALEIDTVPVEPVKLIETSPLIDTIPADDENPVFGKSFFASNNLKIYENVTHIKAPKNYILGSGDEISLNIWGVTEHSGVYTINEDGAIQPERVGKINLKGMTFDQAQKLIENRFGNSYNLSNSNLSIQLNYSKTIRVNIVGEVLQPGTYTVSSINSAFNVIGLAGGLTSLGSVRDIAIKRDGKIVKTLDVYEFLQNPNSDLDFFLLDNDYIIVNSYSKVVQVNGAVKQAMSYQLREEEGIKELIKYSRGFLPRAFTKSIVLNRYKDNQVVVMNIPYDSLMVSNKNFLLNDGDEIFVKEIEADLKQSVELNGATRLKGRFAYIEGMTVADLLEAGEGLKEDAVLERAIVRRRADDFTYKLINIDLNLELTGKLITSLYENDELFIFSKENYLDDQVVGIKGYVRNPIVTPFQEGMTLNELLLLSGGFQPSASLNNIEITRIQKDPESASKDKRIILLKVQASNDLLGGNNSIKLQSGDVIYVRKKPEYNTPTFVTILGEVVYPGSYAISDQNEKITTLIDRAGGANDWAFLEGAKLKRNDTIDSGLPTVFDLKMLLDKKAMQYNYTLHAGDTLIIPRIMDFIKLSGNVNFSKVQQYGSINTPFHNSKRAKFYVNIYGGGFNKRTNKSGTYVESVGNHIKKTHNLLLFKIYPKVNVGDQIVVLQKSPKNQKKDKNKKKIDWNQVIESSMVKLTGMATLYILMQNAFN